MPGTLSLLRPACTPQSGRIKPYRLVSRQSSEQSSKTETRDLALMSGRGGVGRGSSKEGGRGRRREGGGVGEHLSTECQGLWGELRTWNPTASPNVVWASSVSASQSSHREPPSDQPFILLPKLVCSVRRLCCEKQP